MFEVQVGFLSYNGKFFPAGDPILTADNRAFRYGDGCFETMRVHQGEVVLGDLHFERLLASLNLLHFDIPAHFTKAYFLRQIADLCHKNNLTNMARVRFTVFRVDGGLYEPYSNMFNYVIQTWELNSSILGLNENGLVLDVFPDARKTSDKFSPIKSNNCLPYVMGAIYGKQHGLNEVLLLNQYGRVADSTIASVFIVHRKTIYTPPLSEGGVCGVMRKHLLRSELPFKMEEKPLTIEDLENADEIFLTNAIQGIRWVGHFRDNSYGNATAAILHEVLFDGKV
ncbi:aminotransferase class IV [Chitinophaga qingshengii]|uniref:branched-chain-amino-acid transaminase n=1 Tax=Chitinophaga qingshengii TaxID=1569794 RepID=A0ABR7TJU1_9BACT|nr:aminotransferase class IV [Chitinophaga qingshengii]MBC9930766.1 aminotransferase class IV [Chitinophaga qingshengii]